MYFEKIGVHLLWYHITDWLGIVAILVPFGFGVLGVVQILKRSSLCKVDTDIILLGIYYVVVLVTYIFFEIFIVNYRPIILNEGLEASYPSSHTMLILCGIVTAMVQFQKRIKNFALRTAVQTMSLAVITVTIMGRFISGVHWFTDIVAGILLAVSLIMLYISLMNWLEQRIKK